MLENKVAIITGGTRGIGLETARLFLENKAKVIIFGSKKESIDKAIEELSVFRKAVDDIMNSTVEVFTENDLEKAKKIEPLEIS